MPPCVWESRLFWPLPTGPGWSAVRVALLVHRGLQRHQQCLGRKADRHRRSRNACTLLRAVLHIFRPGTACEESRVAMKSRREMARGIGSVRRNSCSESVAAFFFACIRTASVLGATGYRYRCLPSYGSLVCIPGPNCVAHWLRLASFWWVRLAYLLHLLFSICCANSGSCGMRSAREATPLLIPAVDTWL